MKAAERRLKIFEELKTNKYVDVNELAHLFHVTPITIRRDLSRLETQGILTTSYGGATLNEGVSNEPSFDLKSGYSKLYKEQIAYEASLLVHDGDCIYVDCGTTTLELAKYIQHKEITILTNSWKFLSKIDDFSKIKIILAPGTYDPISEGVLSSSTIQFLKNYKVDKAFISTQGVEIEWGVSVPSDTDAQVKKAIMNCSKYNILLVDHTKFGKTFLANHGKLSDFQLIFTDIDIDSYFLKVLLEKKHNVIVCKSLINKKK